MKPPFFHSTMALGGWMLSTFLFIILNLGNEDGSYVVHRLEIIYAWWRVSRPIFSAPFWACVFSTRHANWWTPIPRYAIFVIVFMTKKIPLTPRYNFAMIYIWEFQGAFNLSPMMPRGARLPARLIMVGIPNMFPEIPSHSSIQRNKVISSLGTFFVPY